MNKTLVIFPNQLYTANKALSRQYDRIYIVEEPRYFSSPYKVNKIKLAYMVAAMHAHHTLLPKAQYVEHDHVEQLLHSLTSFDAWDPLDNDLVAKYPKMRILSTPLPNFMLTPSDLEEYHRKHTTTFSHSSFFNFAKAKTNVLTDTHNLDSQNRQSIKQAPAHKDAPQRFNSKHYARAMSYINHHPRFQDHPGSTTHVGMYPITPAHAKQALAAFITHRLHNFGPFEDAIDKDNTILFHSFLSAAMNIGILTPHDVIHAVLHATPKPPMNSVEGFIRQVLGWREYCGYLYKYRAKEIQVANHWGNTSTLPASWYTATTNIPPLNHEIQKALTFGYSHHIIRLMVFLNLMTLHRIHPSDMMKWFMEVVSIDAYPWVMLTNIYMMSWTWTKAMKKPYISTSAYILKMSNYPKGPWCTVWNELFYKFLHDKKDKFVGTSRIYLRHLNRQPSSAS